MPIGPETWLQPALQPGFDKVFELGCNLLSRLTGRGLADEVNKWDKELRIMQALLADAEQRQFSDKSVQIWVRNVKEVTHEMEDVLEHLALQDNEDELKTLDQKVFGFVNHMGDCVSTMFSYNGEGIEEKVANITKCLEGIKEQTVTLQLVKQVGKQPQTLQSEALRSQRETSSVLPKSDVFGRDDMKNDIITRLLGDNYNDQSKENYAMIPIVGMGGIGKTTLAQLLYNEERGNYGLTAWVCVSDVFDVKRITTSIINQVDRNGAGVKFSNLELAQTRLKHLLNGKKFLIVLDDVWNESYENWEKLQIPFQYAAKGSRVIMTTRNVRIANLMNTDPTHGNIKYVNLLSDDACWDIVQHHANNETDLTKMRDDIINKCKGLPLAAKVLGGILKGKSTTSRQIILKSSIWDNDQSEILPVLMLSYHDLPSHLKRIFAYCSIFPKDYRFKEDELVYLCMAQGFLKNNKLLSMAAIAQSNLNELVSRSLLEEVEVHEEGDMWIKKGFTMHDLIHDLALQAAGDIYHVMSTEDRVEVEEKRARHVFLTQHAATTLGNPFPRASRLRTLYFESNADMSIANFDFESFSYIRALRIYSNELRELPEGIGNLKHLRFLSLRCSSITKLPKSISKLFNLQTLCLYGCEKLQIPYDSLVGKKLHVVIEYSSTTRATK